MTEKMLALFKLHCKSIHDVDLYDYQLEPARRIFDAVIKNFRLTSAATEKDIKELKLLELAIEFSRQSGKTTDIVHIIEFIMLYFTTHFGRPVRIGIFAPQREQSKTDFDRLKASLMRSDKDLKVYEAPEEDLDEAREESNSKTIVLPNGASCYVFPVTSTSRPESKTLDLIIFEESQDIDDKILKEQIWPMGASTNAPRIYIGTAGTKICYFYRLGQTGDALKLYFDDIAAQRRKKYKETGDARHLIYERTVEQEIAKHGKDSDEIQRPYYGKWLIGTGQFLTMEALAGITTDRKRTYQDKQNECFAGIDVAKSPDSTVVTIIRNNKDTNKRELLNWLELRGDNYQNQYEIIVDFLEKYKVQAVAIDNTGIGAFLPDMFEVNSNWRDEYSGLYRITFSQSMKTSIYTNLKVSIRELLTTLPNLDTREGERFKQQVLDLQQEWKGQFLSVKHPPNEHDDYPDSWALAEWAYAKYTENRITVAVADATPERSVSKSDEGKVMDYWPGLD